MSDVQDIADRPALEIGGALASGQLDAVELTELLLQRIDNQTSPAFIHVTKERALSEAKAAAVRLKGKTPLSPLDGVPIGWKDLIDLKGEITTAGSDIYRTAPRADQDAPIVANATAAGMVNLGKLNLTEFAYSGIGLNPHFGTPVNPHLSSTPRAPGGSSSGSAIAVAAGLCPCAIGTDTGGSVRIPAAFNALVGYKSSEGRIDKTGVFALSQTLDTVGPIGRSVADCAALDAILRGKNIEAQKRVLPSSTLPLSFMTFIVPENVVMAELEQGVAENFNASVKALEAGGARIISKQISALDQAAHLAMEIGTITGAEAYALHKALVESDAVSRIDQRVVDRIMVGKEITPANLQKLREHRKVCIADMAEALNGAFLLMPTAPVVAPEIAPLEADNDVFHSVNRKTLRNTALGNFLNQPGLALPNGGDGAGIPTSLLVSTIDGDDDRLLAAGIEIERTVRAASKTLIKGVVDDTGRS